MLKTLMMTAVALVMTGCASATVATKSPDYVCQQSAFGCWTEYTGPRDAKAAAEYLNDSKRAVEWVMHRDSVNIESAHYRPSRGELVIQLAPTGKRLSLPLREILAHFNENALYVENIIVMDHNMRTVVLTSRNARESNRFGRARFDALRSLGVEPGEKATTSAVDQAKRAFSPVRRDTFGNVTINY